MAKKQPPKEEPAARGERLQIDLDADLVTRARTIAPSLKLSAPDFLSNLLRPLLDAQWRAFLKEQQEK